MFLWSISRLPSLLESSIASSQVVATDLAVVQPDAGAKAVTAVAVSRPGQTRQQLVEVKEHLVCSPTSLDFPSVSI